MSKYIAYVPVIVWAIVEGLEGENEEELKDLACDHAHLTGFAGNGLTGGKLIGTNARNVTLEIGEIAEGYDINLEVADNV